MAISIPVAATADDRTFQRIADRYEKWGKDTGKKIGSSLAEGIDDPKIEKAFSKVGDAMSKVRAEEAKLQDLREKGASNSRIVAQAEALTRARNAETRATNDAIRAYDGMHASTSRLSTATSALTSALSGTRFGALATDVSNLTSKFGSMGLATGAAITGIAGIAVGAVAAGKALYDLGAQFDDMADKISFSTGRSGDELEAIMDSVRRVGSDTAAPLETIAQRAGEVAQQFKLVGPAADELVQQLALLDEKGNAVGTRDLARTMSLFGVATSDTSKVLDQLFGVSQKTGIPMQDLVSTLQTAGPAAKQFGFDVAQTAGLLANFEQAGLNAAKITPALTIFLKNAAKDGKEAGPALQEVVQRIQDMADAGNNAGAANLAATSFGKGYVEILDAITAHKIDIEALGKAFDSNSEGIQAAAEKTEDLAEAYTKLKNNLSSSFAPAAKLVFDGINAQLETVIDHVQTIGQGFKDLFDGYKSFISPITALWEDRPNPTPLNIPGFDQWTPGAQAERRGARGNPFGGGSIGNSLSMPTEFGNGGGFYPLPRVSSSSGSSGSSGGSSSSPSGGNRDNGLDEWKKANQDFLKAQQDAIDKQQEMWRKSEEVTKNIAGSMDTLSAGLDKDLGLSKGLPGLADNLVRFIGNLAAAPLMGPLNAISAAQGGIGQTGSGLIAMAAAAGGGFPGVGLPGLSQATQGGASRGGVSSRGGWMGDSALLAAIQPGSYETPGRGNVWDLTKGLGDCSSAVEDLVNIMDGRPTAGRSMATGNASEWLTSRGFMPGSMPGAFNVGFSPSHMQATLPDGTPFNWGSDAAAARGGVGGTGAFDPSFTQHYYRPVGGGAPGGGPYAPLSPQQLTDPRLTVPFQVNDAGINGPPLQPGTTIVQNNTGKNEHVVTPEQLSSISNFGKAMAPNPMAGSAAENVGGGATQIGGTEPNAQNGSSQGGGGGLFGAAVGAGAAAADMWAPGSGQAVQIAGQEIQRAIKAGGQFAGIVAGGLMETFLPTGASEIANDNWVTRVAGGFSGMAPQLPNMAGKSPTPVPKDQLPAAAPSQSMPLPEAPGGANKDGGGPTIIFNNTLNSPNHPINADHVKQLEDAQRTSYQAGMPQVGR